MEGDRREAALQEYRRSLGQHKELEAQVKALREQVREAKRGYDKSEDDLKALQSVGQVIGEVLRQLDKERCACPAPPRAPRPRAPPRARAPRAGARGRGGRPDHTPSGPPPEVHGASSSPPGGPSGLPPTGPNPRPGPPPQPRPGPVREGLTPR